MPLKFLIDEHLRGKFARALAERAAVEGVALDLAETGALDGPPLGTKDDALLQWAESHNRVIISLDKNTLPEFLVRHLASGHASPGILFVRHTRSWDEILFHLVLLAAVASPDECRDCCQYVPS